MTSTIDRGPPPGVRGTILQIQIVTMVFTGVNILAAAGMVARILWDTRKIYMKRRRSLGKDDMGAVEDGGARREGDRGGGGGVKPKVEVEQKVSTSGSSKRLIGGGGPNRRWWEMIPTIEVFPLILGVTILVQGTMLAVVEGKGLDKKFFQGNCRYPSEVAWVALWITPYIVLSFTIETAIRALSQPRFQPRSGKAVLYCIFFALVLTLLTWIPSRTMPEDVNEDICSGTLMSFVDQFAAGGLGIMVALLPIAIFMGVVIFMHLTKGVAIDRVEKMASSRTVYFLIINVLQWIMMVPNYVLTAQNHPRYSVSGLATISANVAGIAASVLHFYLRTQTGIELHEDIPSVVYPETNRLPTAREKEVSITERRTRQDGGSIHERPAIDSILSEYYDVHTISELPRSPALSERSALETTSILRIPRSPTSTYSKEHRSSRAPSLFSQHSFKRLGDEINHMIAGLRADSSAESKRKPVPPTQRKPASNYTLFPPSTEHPCAPHTPASKSQEPAPTRTLLRPPTRPSRATVPIVNMDRRQSNFRMPDWMQLQKPDLKSQTLQVPKPVARVNPANLKKSPAKPFEVAIPPRPDNADAESFMEILIWKKDNGEENRV